VPCEQWMRTERAFLELAKIMHRKEGPALVCRLDWAAALYISRDRL
jgi:hypothetical protein